MLKKLFIGVVDVHQLNTLALRFKNLPADTDIVRFLHMDGPVECQSDS